MKMVFFFSKPNQILWLKIINYTWKARLVIKSYTLWGLLAEKLSTMIFKHLKGLSFNISKIFLFLSTSLVKDTKIKALSIKESTTLISHTSINLPINPITRPHLIQIQTIKNLSN